MTIVEIIDAHQGFKLVTDSITTRKPRTLLWVVSVLYFHSIKINILMLTCINYIGRNEVKSQMIDRPNFLY